MQERSDLFLTIKSSISSIIQLPVPWKDVMTFTLKSRYMTDPKKPYRNSRHIDRGVMYKKTRNNRGKEKDMVFRHRYLRKIAGEIQELGSSSLTRCNGRSSQIELAYPIQCIVGVNSQNNSATHSTSSPTSSPSSQSPPSQQDDKTGTAETSLHLYAHPP